MLAAYRVFYFMAGGCLAVAFLLTALTAFGWVRWAKTPKNCTLVEKMLADVEPQAHRVSLISERRPSKSVAEFCQMLPQCEFTESPPSAGAIGKMLAKSHACLMTGAALDVIETCRLDDDEALAICVYTAELEEQSFRRSWFESQSSQFQIYREMNAALRSEDPARIAYWHPLIYYMVRGLRKMQAHPQLGPRIGLPRPETWWTRARALFEGCTACCRETPTGFRPHKALRDRAKIVPTVYRGVPLSAGSYQPGFEVVWPAFSSTSAAISVAQAFCDASEDQLQGRTMFFIETHSAVNIQALSHFPKEEEVLMLPGVVFRVGTCGCDKFDKFSNGVRFIELVEIKPHGDAPPAARSPGAADAVTPLRAPGFRLLPSEADLVPPAEHTLPPVEPLSRRQMSPHTLRLVSGPGSPPAAATPSLVPGAGPAPRMSGDPRPSDEGAVQLEDLPGTAMV